MAHRTESWLHGSWTNKCPPAFTVSEEEVGRLCLVRLEVEFQELVTTTMASKGRRDRGRAE